MDKSALPRLPVDFGNCDVDGAVRLVTQGTKKALMDSGITLKEGMLVAMSDSEISAIGFVTFRGGMWVAVVDRWIDEATA